MISPIGVPKMNVSAATPVNLAPLTKAANDARLEKMIPTQNLNVRDAVRRVELPKNLSEIMEAVPKKPKALLLLGAAILVGIGAVVKNKIDAKKEGKINTQA